MGSLAPARVERCVLMVRAKPNRAGFTLIELLVVVGVLLVLVALLMPAFAKARRQARLVGCLANLRELHESFRAYVRYNDQYPEFDPEYHGIWLRSLRPGSPALDHARLCPEAAEPSYGWGSATTAWGPYDPDRTIGKWMSFLQGGTSSYGFNGWLEAAPDKPDAPFHKRGDTTPSVIPVFADANWVDAFPTSLDNPPADLSRGSTVRESHLGRFCIARHGQFVNSIFLDGHAEQVPLTDLWQLKWSADFIPRQVRMPHDPADH
jgi:prepilin-type N-terminal cleavage/methylation domain-containing protein/prepilin-type processing-associated H-X9-DG protein